MNEKVDTHHPKRRSSLGRELPREWKGIYGKGQISQPPVYIKGDDSGQLGKLQVWNLAVLL